MLPTAVTRCCWQPRTLVTDCKGRVKPSILTPPIYIYVRALDVASNVVGKPCKAGLLFSAHQQVVDTVNLCIHELQVASAI